MGLYDGGKNGISSTAAVAKLLKAPVLLVINAKSMGESAAALALGPQAAEIEINPLQVRARGQGAVALDALLLTRTEITTEES